MDVPLTGSSRSTLEEMETEDEVTLLSQRFKKSVAINPPEPTGPPTIDEILGYCEDPFLDLEDNPLALSAWNKLEEALGGLGEEMKHHSNLDILNSEEFISYLHNEGDYYLKNGRDFGNADPKDDVLGPNSNYSPPLTGDELYYAQQRRKKAGLVTEPVGVTTCTIPVTNPSSGPCTTSGTTTSPTSNAINRAKSFNLRPRNRSARLVIKRNPYVKLYPLSSKALLQAQSNLKKLKLCQTQSVDNSLKKKKKNSKKSDPKKKNPKKTGPKKNKKVDPKHKTKKTDPKKKKQVAGQLKKEGRGRPKGSKDKPKPAGLKKGPRGRPRKIPMIVRDTPIKRKKTQKVGGSLGLKMRSCYVKITKLTPEAIQRIISELKNKSAQEICANCIAKFRRGRSSKANSV